MSNKPHISALTSMRFFAAFAVILFHFGIWLPQIPLITFSIFLYGNSGVGFFYLLSGFILTYTYHDWFKNGVVLKKYFNFFRARFARIYPVYFFALVVTSIVVLYFLSWVPKMVSSYYGTEITNSFLITSWLINLLLLQTYLFNLPILRAWDGPSWSISCEFFFYILFPFVIAYSTKHFNSVSKALKVAICTLLVSAIILLSVLVFNWFHPIYDGNAYSEKLNLIIYFFPPFRFPEFIIGCTLGLLYIHGSQDQYKGIVTRLKNSKDRDLLLMSGLLLTFLFIGLCIAFSSPYIHVMHKDFFVYLLKNLFLYEIFIIPFALIVISLAHGKTLLSPLLDHPWMVLLGEASYSLYIIQVIPFLIVKYYQQQTGVTLNSLIVTGIVLATVASSIIIYKIIEVPARRIIRGDTTTKKTPVKIVQQIKN